jgi:DNA modification methylase
MLKKLWGGASPLLMVTDPPYGVEYDASWREEAGIGEGAQGKVLNDDRADWQPAWELFPGDVAYIWHAGAFSPCVADSLIAADFQLRNLIIWAKDRLVISRGNYHHQHEPCWYAVRKGKPAQFTEDRTQTTLFKNIDDVTRPDELVFLAKDKAKRVYAIRGDKSTLWQIPKPTKSETGHSTQKPVECMARPIRNHESEYVYEPFSGSGTTIIACEKLKRKCRALELNPAYVAVALQRWADATGKTPKLMA